MATALRLTYNGKEHVGHALEIQVFLAKVDGGGTDKLCLEQLDGERTEDIKRRYSTS